MNKDPIYKEGDLIIGINSENYGEMFEILEYFRGDHDRGYFYEVLREDDYPDHFHETYIEDPDYWRLATKTERVLYGPKGHEDE